MFSEAFLRTQLSLISQILWGLGNPSSNFFWKSSIKYLGQNHSDTSSKRQITADLWQIYGRFMADFLHTSPAASNTLPWTTQMCSWGPSHVGGDIQVCWSTPEAVLQREGSKTSLPEGLRAGCSGLPSGRPPGGSHTHPCLHGSVALNPNGGFARCTWAALLSRPCWHSLRRGKSTACVVPPA